MRDVVLALWLLLVTVSVKAEQNVDREYCNEFMLSHVYVGIGNGYKQRMRDWQDKYFHENDTGAFDVDYSYYQLLVDDNELYFNEEYISVALTGLLFYYDVGEKPLFDDMFYSVVQLNPELFVHPMPLGGGAPILFAALWGRDKAVQYLMDSPDVDVSKELVEQLQTIELCRPYVI